MLNDMTVVDFTQQLPGPYATALLRNLGARVIKVEPPKGDPSRALDPAMFDRVNVGKESITLDLKSDPDREAALRLIAACDVVVESFRPGVMDRLGVGWEACRAVNPRVVFCSVSGFGRVGPYAKVPVHDLNLMAWGDPAGARRMSGRIGVPWVDLGAGTMAALEMVSAWTTAKTTGTGARLDVSMMDIALSWSRIKPPRPGSEPSYGVYLTSDEREVIVAILEDHFWAHLCQALDLEDLVNDPSLATYEERLGRAEELNGRISARIAQLALDEVMQLAREYDVPVTTLDPRDDEQALSQLRIAGFAPDDFSRGSSAATAGVDQVPGLGEHTIEVLAEFGVTS